MMMSVCGRSSNRYPFTATQWQELEHQALVYKYMVSGMPIPPDLLFTIRKSLDSSLSSNFLLHQPHHIGWNSGFHMGFGRKIDPEPGRCRRTDGKKWRCSKEAYTDSKYCERHMHRGRNRSRKPVENTNSGNNILSPAPKATIPNAIPISPSQPKSTTQYSSTSPSSTFQDSHFLYPHFPGPASSGIGLLSSQETNTNNFFLDSNAYSGSTKDYRNSSFGHEMKGGDSHSDEHAFFSSDASCNNPSGTTIRNDDSSWQLAPLTMGSPLLSQLKSNSSYTYNNYASAAGLHSGKQPEKHRHGHCYNTGRDDDDDDQEPKKVMHHFIDEFAAKDKHSNWLSSDHDNISTQRTQLSISIPNSVHDFFMTQK